jgi:hypothetical protein
MAHTLTPSSSNSVAAISVPDPGDPRTAASVEAPFQAIDNTLLWTQLHIPPIASAGWEQGVTGSQFDALAGGAWTFTAQFWLQTDVSAAAVLYKDVDAPPGYVINQAHARIRGNGFGVGVHSALPATMPKLTLYELDPFNNNAVLQSANATDSSANAAAYDAAHSINITGLTWTISGSRRYRVKLEGEAGANALANRLTLSSFAISWSPA